MAYATSTYIALAAAAAASAANAYNTNQTAKRQDNQAAEAIMAQQRKQHDADSRVNKEVTSLEGSTSNDERIKRMGDYMAQLARTQAQRDGGIQTAVGSDAYKADATTALDGVDARASQQAGLMARMDAPMMQRQGEAVGFGHLGTDIGMLARESRGQQFIDDLRMRAIRRNGNLDFASGVLGAIGGAGFGAGGAGSGLTTYGTPQQVMIGSQFTTPKLNAPPKLVY